MTQASNALVRNEVNPQTVRQLGKLRAFIRAVRTKIRAIFGTVAALKKARRDGGTADWDALIDKLTGTDEQVAFDRERAAETEAIARQNELDYTPPTAEQEAAGMAFSVSRRTDKPKSWDEVQPGHLWASAKRFLPKTDEARPGFAKRSSWEQLVPRVAGWLSAMGDVSDPWGAS